MRRARLAGFFLGLFFCHSLNGFGQWTSYLNSNYINQIVSEIVSADTLVWCASTGGVIRYDPTDTSFTKKITNVDGLSDNDVLGLASDDDGNKWFLCRSAVSLMSPDGLTWAYFTDLWHGIPGQRTLSVAIDGDTVWLGTDEGGWYWNTRGDPFTQGEAGTVFDLRNNTILTILPDGQYMWFGTQGGVCRALKQSPGDTSNQVWYTTAQGLPNNEVKCLIYSDSTLWAGTADGVGRLEDTLWIQENQGLPSRNVRSLAANGDTIWAATARGVAVYDGVGWNTLNEGLLSTDVRSVAVDPSGVVWAGTAWEGIAQLVDSTWQPHVFDGPAGNHIVDIALDHEGGLWCTHYLDPNRAARTKVSRLYQGRWEIYNDQNEWRTGNIHWVTVDSEGNKWFGIWAGGEWGGLVKLEADNETYERYETPVSQVIGAIAVDRSDNKWVSAYNTAVLRLSSDDSTWTVYSNDCTEDVITITTDAGLNAWFGSGLGGGVTGLTREGDWERLGGLPSELIHSLSVDLDGNLWVGTSGGICEVEDGMVGDPYTGDGLLGDIAREIVCDWQGGMWFQILEKGVSRLNPDGTWTSYTPGEGLVSADIDQDVAALAFDTESGVLWVGTKYGLSRFETGIYPPSPHIDSIGVYPNPFIPSRPDHSKVVFCRIPDGGVVRIYTFSGELVKEMLSSEVNPVTHQAFWDGTNTDGVRVASGIYVFSVTAAGRKSTGKIALIR